MSRGGNTTARGYGYEHQRLRAVLSREAIGTACHLCGEVMEAGEPLALDHSTDRRGYRGMVHARCNAQDGARRGNRMRGRRGDGGAFPPA